MNNKAKEIIEAHKRCDAFFKEILDNALNNQRLQISQEAAFYLLGILIMGMKKDPNMDTKTLAEKYLIACHTEEATAFKAIGDLSLIIAGIWWQSLLRKLIDIDYYINIGSRSYRKASEATPRNFAELFEELSENFDQIVNIMIEATCCISEISMSDKDILRMYEVWLRTHNIFIEQKLRSLGIDVVPGTTTKQ